MEYFPANQGLSEEIMSPIYSSLYFKKNANDPLEKFLGFKFSFVYDFYILWPFASVMVSVNLKTRIPNSEPVREVESHFEDYSL